MSSPRKNDHCLIEYIEIGLKLVLYSWFFSSNFELICCTSGCFCDDCELNHYRITAVRFKTCKFWQCKRLYNSTDLKTTSSNSTDLNTTSSSSTDSNSTDSKTIASSVTETGRGNYFNNANRYIISWSCSQETAHERGSCVTRDATAGMLVGRT